MARTEHYKEGKYLFTPSVPTLTTQPLHQTPYTVHCVSVWIFKGEVIGDVDLTPGAQAKQEAESSRGRRNDNNDDAIDEK